MLRFQAINLILLLLVSFGCNNPKGGSVIAGNHTPLLQPPAAFSFTQIRAVNGNVKLIWQSSTRAETYEFTMGTDAAAITTAVPACSNDRETCELTGLDPDTTYYYSVKAINSAGSKIITSAGRSRSVGSFDLTSATAGDGTIALNWGTSSNATSYNVIYGTSPGSYPSTVTGITAPYTLSGLSNGTMYYVRIVAVNSDNGYALSTTEAAERPFGPLGAPQNLVATATPGAIALDWDDLGGATSYEIWDTTGTVLIGTSASSAFTHSHGSNGTTYTYKVRALNGFNGAFSSVVTARSIAAFAITSAVTGPLPGQVTVTWPGAVTGAAAFNIRYGSNPAALSSQVTNVTSPYVFSGLTGGLPYYFTVVATNPVGLGTSQNSSNQLSATPVAAISAPTGLAAAAAPTGITLTWTAVSGATLYNIYRGTSSGSYAFLNSSATNSYSDTSAAPGTTYFYVVRSSNGLESTNSLEVSKQSIANFTFTSATVATFSSVDLVWPAATGATGYDILYGTTSGSYTSSSLNRTSPTTLTGLTAATTYYIVVRAKNATGGGTTLLNNELSFTTSAQFPTVTITGYSAINNSNVAAYSLSGTCTENTRAVTLSVGGVAGSTTCAANAWSLTMDVSAAADSATLSIVATHTNSGGNSDTDTKSVVKDAAPPTVAITSSPSIRISNEAAYVVSGTCSENTRTVSVSVGGINATPTCTALAWSTTINTTVLADSSSVSITANHSDAAGNTATQATTTVAKDTVAPAVAISVSPVINNANKAAYVFSGTCSETGINVSVQVGAVTGTASCLLLTWTATLDVTSVSDSLVALVTADQSDAAGNPATQASTLVVKDTANPTVTIASSPTIINANKAAYPISGTCSENTRTVNVSVGGVTAAPTCAASTWSATLDVTALADGSSIAVSATHTDAYANTLTVSTTVVKSTALPTVAITSSTSITNTNQAAYVVTGTCSENARTVSVNVGGVAASPTCSSLAWSATLNVSAVADNSSVSITADHSDAVGNSANQATTSVLKDTAIPVVAINAPSTINNANAAAYTLTGTCSENGRTVAVNAGGVTGSPTCSAGAWSTTLNVTGVADGATVAITANHTDSVGNAATQASSTVVKDTAVPVVAITSSPSINNTNVATYTVSGTCSENTRTVSVNVGGVSGSATCSASAWSATLNVTAVADNAAVPITADHADASGNSATQASASVVKDTGVPTVAITSSPVINNANKAAYTVTGTCSENGRTVTVNVGGVSGTPSCSSNTWTTSLDVSAVADGASVAITANHSDAAGNSATQASTTVLKDTSNPTVAITSSPNINAGNAAAYIVSGTCSENSRTVSVSVGGVTGTPTCSAGAWSSTLNVTGVADAPSVSITANHTDAAGNSATQASTTVLKVTGLPTVAITSSPAINDTNKAAYPISGTCSENTRTVSLSVGGVTASPSCTSNAWSATLNVAGLVDASSVAITADHDDSVGNDANQATASVLKDTVIPTVAITSAPTITNSNKATYPISGTCSESSSTVTVTVGSVTGTPTCTALAWSTTLNVTAVADGASVAITADHTDAANNAATQASTSAVKDTVIPTVTIASAPTINNANKAAYPVSGACSENTSIVSVVIGGVSATPTCSALAWSAVLDLSAVSDSATITVMADHTDAAGNAATQASTTVVKDTTVPTVAITSSPAINNTNKAAYTVSGTCSENGRTVFVSVGGVAGTPNCSALAWTTTLDVSGLTDSASVAITANHSDAAGNSASQASTSVEKDTVAPTVAITAPVNITNSNKASYPISGTCTEDTRIVTVVVGGVSGTPTCTAGAWSTTLNVTSVGDGSAIAITADHTDAASNNATQATATTVKDVGVPTVAITSAPPINDTNKGAYPLSGTCSDNTRTVTVVVGGVSATPTCSALAWSASVNVSAVSDGASVAITADHSDAAGNAATQASTTVLKDTVIPTVAITSAPAINNANKAAYPISGTCSESSRPVTVVVGGISANPTCTALAWSTTLNVTAVVDNGSVAVTANHTDAASNAATQASTTVAKDTGLPTVAISSPSIINNANKTSYTVSGTCTETGRSVSVMVGTVSASDSCTLLTWSVTVDATMVIDSVSVLITADHSDAAGNSAVQAATSTVKDSVNPTVALNASAAITNANKTAYTVTGTCSENTRTVTVSVGGVAATPTCSSGTWTTGAINVSAAADSATLSITANHTDSAGNTATQASTTVVKDTAVPTVAITSSPTINLANRTAYTASGTCSENTRTVTVSIGGVAATPTCTAGAWTTGAISVSAAADSATLSITANHSDAAGNAATQASASVLKDTVAPSVILSSASGNPVFGAFAVRATFSETVTGVLAGDFTVSNAATSGFTAVSGTNYDITLTPSVGGAVTADMAAAAATDAAGNASTAATQFTRTYQTTATLSFAVTSTHDFGSITTGGSSDVTMVINKTGVANATSVTEVSLAAPFAFKGGTFPGTGGTCTTTISGTCSIVVTFTPTAAGVRSDSVDLQYNNGSTTVTISRSITGTGVILTPTLVDVDGPSGVMINQCIPFTVYSKTAAGLVANVTANQTVNLVVNNGAGTFYSNVGCTTTITSTSIAIATSSKVIYFKATTANQNLTLVFNPATLTPTTKYVETSTTPTRVSVNPPLEMQTNTCVPIVVDLVDAAGNKAGRAVAVQVNLTENGNAVYYSDSLCTGVITSTTFPAFTETKTVYVSNPTAQAITLTFTDNAGTLTADTAPVTFVSALTWWNTAFYKRIPLTLDNLDQAVAHTNIQVLVRLNSSRINYADTLAGGADIRFTLDDHSTVLSYDIESWNSSGESLIWVRIPSLSASSQRIIYMYYDNVSATTTESASATWSGYSGVWNMDKSGANYIDATGSGKTGTPVGTVTDVAGPTGSSISLNGSSSINTGFALETIIGRTSTFSVWMKSAQAGNNTVWLAPGITGVEQSGGGNDIFFGHINAAGFILITAGNGASASSSYKVNDSNWRLVTMSRNETTGAVRFYINGVLTGTGTSETGSKTTTFNSFGFVRNTGGASNYYNGFLDGIRLSNSILTDDRIKAEYKFSIETNITYGAPEDL